MTDETRDTGIPTRAIHEAYLGMQAAHRRYRQARDEAGVDESQAQAGFQDAVLTFYELVRPHLKRKSSMQRLWDGELPDYPDRWWQSTEEAKRYCQQYGTAVWQLQHHVQTAAQSASVSGNGTALADGGGGGPAEWHERLNLTDKQRVVSVSDDSGTLVWVELRAVTGLRQLDTWDTRQRRERTRGGGFMAGQSATTVTLEYVNPNRLTRAKRLLAEAADKMGLLSRIDIDHEDGAIVNFDQSDGNGQAEYRDTEYDGSPDI